MSPKDLLKINGNFDCNSLLMKTASEIHKIFSDNKICYVIIGGLAVIRNGALRTTGDIDILMSKSDWQKIKKKIDQKKYKIGFDIITNLENNITIDILFKEDKWNSFIALPDPSKVSEYDNELDANFIGLYHLLELKIATYLTKKKEDGIEIASKDLYDVVELIKHNDIDLTKISLFHKKIKNEFMKIYKKVKKYKKNNLGD